MLIPIYVLVGVWGGPRRVKATVTFVHLHDGRLAPHARLDRRARDLEGHVPARRPRDELERLVFLGFLVAVRRQGAAAPVPRLAAGSRTRRRRPRSGRCSRASSRRRPCSGSSGSSLPHFPEPVEDFRDGRARARGRDAPLRVGARIPPDRHPRRGRLLVDGPDGAHRARHLCDQRSRARRRRAPVGEPRPRLRGPLPARGDDRDAHRHRRPRPSSAGWPRGARSSPRS